jgi:hypothetical protein
MSHRKPRPNDRPRAEPDDDRHGQSPQRQAEQVPPPAEQQQAVQQQQQQQDDPPRAAPQRPRQGTRRPGTLRM